MEATIIYDEAAHWKHLLPAPAADTQRGRSGQLLLMAPPTQFLLMDFPRVIPPWDERRLLRCDFGDFAGVYEQRQGRPWIEFEKDAVTVCQPSHRALREGDLYDRSIEIQYNGTRRGFVQAYRLARLLRHANPSRPVQVFASEFEEVGIVDLTNNTGGILEVF